MYTVHKNSVHTTRRTNYVSIINSNEVKLFEKTVTITGLPNPADEGTSQMSTGYNNAEHKILQQHLECRNPYLFRQSQGTNNTLCRWNAKCLNVTAGGTQQAPGCTRLHGAADQTHYRLHYMTLAPTSQKKQIVKLIRLMNVQVNCYGLFWEAIETLWA
jgi:hypothetical protein